MNRGIVFEFVKQSPQGKVRLQEKWNLPSEVLPCLGTGLVITWEEVELKIFITYALIYMLVQESCFCLGWKCCVIRRVCLSGSCTISQAPPPIYFFLFSYSFLCVVLEEGSDFFHSQCKTAENRVSTVWVPHFGVSPPSEEFWKGVWLEKCWLWEP